MAGYLAILLHAHLPFVRHPEHDRFLEESWLYEAITETYIPLLELIEQWQQDRLNVRITLSLSPTLCAMLLDPLLQARYERRLAELIDLAEKETFRTHWDAALRPLAEAYVTRFREVRRRWHGWDRDLVAAFRRFQDEGRIEIITCAATHALLPLLAGHPPALRAQILTARDHYRACFGRDPVGIWLPECAYAPAVEPALQEANLRWFVVDAHGLLNARPRPRFGVYAPVFTPDGLAVFGRDLTAARQVWSRHEGYPGDARYRDFYRDVGFDLDEDYVRPYWPSPQHRGFTGVKYHRITGTSDRKEPYDPQAAAAAAREHARHFLEARLDQLRQLDAIMDRPPVIVTPYDAELFGHWWHEGPHFLDALVRLALEHPPALEFVTPTDYLRAQSTLDVALPSPSSWGENGHWQVWLNPKNEWIQPHLRAAEQRLTELTQRFLTADDTTRRALDQAARELLLAQASDWPFMLNAGTCPEYARRRVTGHLDRFFTLERRIRDGQVSLEELRRFEEQDNLFPRIDYRYWMPSPG